MEHIFDNRHILQSFVVQGGCKVSVSPASKKYMISFEEAKQFFFSNSTDLEFQKIKEYLYSAAKEKMSCKEIILWCGEVMENALTNHRSYDLNGRISLRELFMERIAVSGSAYAIIFLKKHFYMEKKIVYSSENFVSEAA